MYPKDNDQAKKFRDGIITSLHSDATRNKIMATLTKENIPVAMRIGTVAAKAITALLFRVKTQANDSPDIKLLIEAIKFTVKEVATMAKIAGVVVTDRNLRDAAKIAGDLIESGMNGGNGNGQQMVAGGMQQQQAQQQRPAPPQQQSGLMGGVANG